MAARAVDDRWQQAAAQIRCPRTTRRWLFYARNHANRELEAAYEDFSAHNHPRASERIDTFLSGFGALHNALSGSNEHRHLLAYSHVASNDFPAAARRFAEVAGATKDPMVHAVIGMSPWPDDDRTRARATLLKLSDCGWCQQSVYRLDRHDEADKARVEPQRQQSELLEAMRKPAGCLAVQ